VLLRNLGANVTLPDVALRIATSPRQLQRAFAENTESSFSGYLLRLRMTRAARLLNSSELPVSEIARGVGYGTGGQFSRAFAQFHGTPPLQYRRTQRDKP
jgi:AraC family transcriptional regulator of adaptative response / methylphosphotriester-DNA alkyltransferase methyltransferase